MSVQFEVESAVEPLGAGRYRAHFSHDWWVHVGPNGGIVAASLLRACSNEIASLPPGGGPRVPRTLTVHYLAPPRAGAAEVTVSIERAGRGVTFLSARLVQAGRAVAVALAAYAAPRAAFDFGAKAMPEIPPPELCPPLVEPADLDGGPAVTIRDRWDCRIGIGPIPAKQAPEPAATPPRTAPVAPGSPGDRARSGGWIRLDEPSPLDHHVLAAMADGWMPPIFTLPAAADIAVPTVELTVHFRDSETLAGLAPDAWSVCLFSSELSQEGFVEEDGLIWSADGRLLAMSRQLSVVTPRGDGPATRVAP